MSDRARRVGGALGRLLHGPDTRGAARRPRRARAARSRVPSDGDGVWEVRTVQGRPCLTPDERSLLPLLRAARGASARAPRRGLWLEVEYFGDRYGAVPRAVRLDRPRRPTTRASTSRPSSAGTATPPGCAASGARSSRCPTSTPRARRTRARPSASSSGSEVLISRRDASPCAPPADAAAFTRDGAAARAAQAARPLLPDQLPLHRDHQRLQLQVHVVPGRHHGPPARLHEEGEGLPDPGRDRGQARPGWARSTRSSSTRWASRCCTPTSPAIVEHAESRGVRHRAQHELRPHHARRTSTPSTARASPT